MQSEVAGRVDTILKIKVCTDACKSIESSEEGIGALESVSRISICYSGVYAVVKIFATEL